MSNKEIQKIWITGASSGIGEALALHYSNLGADLILSSRNVDDLNKVRSACKFPNKRAIVTLDLADFQFIERIGKEVWEKHGPIDILINNAGISQRSLAVETKFEVDQKLINVDLLGTIAVTKSILPQMLQRNQGSIVTVTSVVGKIGTPLRSSYAAAKHGLHGFFDSLRAELASSNLHILLVCPGFVKTNVSVNALTAEGKTQGTMDNATANGLEPAYVAKKIAQAIDQKREEVWIAGAKEKLAINLKRFFPRIFSKIIAKNKVT